MELRVKVKKTFYIEMDEDDARTLHHELSQVLDVVQATMPDGVRYRTVEAVQDFLGSEIR